MKTIKIKGLLKTKTILAAGTVALFASVGAFAEESLICNVTHDCSAQVQAQDYEVAITGDQSVISSYDHCSQTDPTTKTVVTRYFYVLASSDDHSTIYASPDYKFKLVETAQGKTVTAILADGRKLLDQMSCQ